MFVGLLSIVVLYKKLANKHLIGHVSVGTQRRWVHLLSHVNKTKTNKIGKYESNLIYNSTLVWVVLLRFLPTQPWFLLLFFSPLPLSQPCPAHGSLTLTYGFA